ncbi:hypothetical protein E2562_033737 [Oryza meyeriana var. granulata]|uniref:Uncharacterized protein n=1 Tax=Oryza meyeriana var. granulata TaxID=110450 RepID=A0A6G1E6X5_9ORYZ|nr:hypothetical protein E2562_033737 [Oryza meyeriana var. granulata]
MAYMPSQPRTPRVASGRSKSLLRLRCGWRVCLLHLQYLLRLLRLLGLLDLLLWLPVNVELLCDVRHYLLRLLLL